jgi:ligand-binding sensor protein
VVAAVVALFGQCPQSKVRQTLTCENGNFSSAGLNAEYVAAQAVHQKRVTAGVCGYSANGLLSGDLLGLVLGGSILPHKAENDGVVRVFIGKVDVRRLMDI